MKKKIILIILFIILILGSYFLYQMSDFAKGVIDDAKINRNVKLSQEELNLIEEEKQYNVIINGIEYARVIPFSEQVKHIVYATTKKSDSLQSITYIINKLNDNVIGEMYVFDNGGDYFNNGVARFRKNNKVGLINKKGEVVLQPSYDEIFGFDGGYSKVINICKTDSIDDKKYGLIDSIGNIFIPVIYDYIDGGATQFVDSNMNLHSIKPSNVNYNLIFNITGAETYLDEDLIVFSPISMIDTANEFKTPYGTYYGENGILKVFPITNKEKPAAINYEYISKACGTIKGTINNTRTSGKLYLQFGEKNSQIEINSITPGLCIDENCTSYCQGSLGIYYKDKNKLNEN